MRVKEEVEVERKKKKREEVIRGGEGGRIQFNNEKLIYIMSLVEYILDCNILIHK